jgi:hypothetical protein
MRIQKGDIHSVEELPGAVKPITNYEYEVTLAPSDPFWENEICGICSVSGRERIEKRFQELAQIFDEEFNKQGPTRKNYLDLDHYWTDWSWTDPTLDSIDDAETREVWKSIMALVQAHGCSVWIFCKRYLPSEAVGKPWWWTHYDGNGHVSSPKEKYLTMTVHWRDQ